MSACLAFKLFTLVDTEFTYTNYIPGGRQGKASRNQASADRGTLYFWLMELHGYFYIYCYMKLRFSFSSTKFNVILSYHSRFCYI